MKRIAFVLLVVLAAGCGADVDSYHEYTAVQCEVACTKWHQVAHACGWGYLVQCSVDECAARLERESTPLDCKSAVLEAEWVECDAVTAEAAFPACPLACGH